MEDRDAVIASVISEWFGWPNGAVLTNLIASLIWGGFAWRKLHNIHKHVKRQRVQHEVTQENVRKIIDHLGI